MNDRLCWDDEIWFFNCYVYVFGFLVSGYKAPSVRRGFLFWDFEFRNPLQTLNLTAPRYFELFLYIGGFRVLKLLFYTHIQRWTWFLFYHEGARHMLARIFCPFFISISTAAIDDIVTRLLLNISIYISIHYTYSYMYIRIYYTNGIWPCWVETWQLTMQ